jgi:hypothetical protein
MTTQIDRTDLGRWAARGAALFFVAFAGFQLALALGAPFGMMTWGGSSAVLPDPMRAASAGAAVVLIGAAAAMLVRAGDWGRTLPRLPFLILNWVFAAYLALNTAGNFASKSRDERLIMGWATVIGLVLCVLAATLARARKTAG